MLSVRESPTMGLPKREIERRPQIDKVNLVGFFACVPKINKEIDRNRNAEMAVAMIQHRKHFTSDCSGFYFWRQNGNAVMAEGCR